MSRLSRFLAFRKVKKEQKQTEFEQQLWESRRPLLETQNQIKEEKKELKNKRNKIKFPSWSKLLLIILFSNFILLELFIGWITIKSFAIALSIGMMPDFTPLITLISAVVGETLAYGFYIAKSKAENTEGGIVFQQMMNELNSTNDDEIDEETYKD